MWKCPKCKGAGGEKLRIYGVVVSVVIDADGESAEPETDILEWGGENTAVCECGFRGTAADCEIEDDEEGDSDMAKKKETVGPADLPPDVLASMKAVVAYNWESELEDAKEEGPEGHVFTDLVVLDNFINGTDASVESYIGDDDEDDEDDEDDDEEGDEEGEEDDDEEDE